MTTLEQEINAINNQDDLTAFLVKQTGNCFDEIELKALRLTMLTALPNTRQDEVDMYIDALPVWFNISIG